MRSGRFCEAIRTDSDARRHSECLWLHRQFGCAASNERARTLHSPVVCLSVCEEWNDCGDTRREVRTEDQLNSTTVLRKECGKEAR